jgi:hypothetical protein
VFNGKRCWEVEDLEAFAKRNPDSIIATESTIHGYRAKTRESLLQVSKKHNVVWMAARSIFTSRARGGAKSDDKADARAIWKNFTERPGLFYRLRPPSETLSLGTINKPGTPRFEANVRLVALRREGYPGFEGHREASIFVLDQVAREFNLNRRERDTLAGFHACGYGSLWRSNRNKHGVGRKFNGEWPTKTTTEIQKNTLKSWRQDFRKLWAQAPLPLPPQEGPITSAPETFLDGLCQELNP